MTAPGVGPITAVRFRAAIDDVTRFRSAHAVGSYLGLVPGEHSSSDSQHRLGITKAGSTRLRTCLIQSAWCARRCRNTPQMVQWSLEVEKRRGKHVAIVALARKIAGILFAMWRDGKDYDPQHA
jgi:transposase